MKSIGSKFWITIIIVITLSSLFNYITTLYLYEHLYVQQAGEHLEELGEKVTSFYKGGIIDKAFRDMVATVNNLSPEEIVLVDDIKAIDSCLPVDKDKNAHFSDEQMKSLYAGEVVTLIREKVSCDRDLIIKVFPLIDKRHDNKLIGILLFNIPLTTINEAVLSFKHLLILYIVIFVIVGLILGKIVTVKITKHLREMEIVAEKMVDGDFDAKVEVSTDDEVGRLGNTLNHLSESLKGTIALLSKEKKQLSQILDGISDSVLTIYQDNDEAILCNNPARNLFRRMGLTKQDFVYHPKVEQLIEKVDKEKKVTVKEISINEFIFLLYLGPLTEDGKLWGIAIVIQDITDERKRESDARDFLAIVSHELRTPLSYVRGYTEALMDGVAETKEKEAHYLKTIHMETVRMERLVNDLLDLAQLEKGTYPMNKEVILLENVIAPVIERYRSIYSEKGVALSYENFAKNPLWMIGDEDRIIQILVNLLDNAFRHTPEHESVRVTTGIFEEDIILKIEDTGEGIQEDKLSKLGNKFYRIDKARSRKNGGIGLGLAIVKQIVERLNGRIEVRSKVGKGTTFIIYFPLNQQKD